MTNSSATSSLPAVPANLKQSCPTCGYHREADVPCSHGFHIVPATASPDQDFLKLVDEFELAVAALEVVMMKPFAQTTNSETSDAGKTVSAARQSLVDYLEGIRAERDDWRRIAEAWKHETTAVSPFECNELSPRNRRALSHARRSGPND